MRLSAAAAAAALWPTLLLLEAAVVIPAVLALEPLTLNSLQSVPCTPTPSNKVPLDPTSLRNALDLIPPLLDRIRPKLANAPGAAVIVVQGGRVINFTASGQAAPGVPFSPDTIVRIASNTKMFTSLAAYRLRDQGRLSLDDPIAKWIPGFSVQSPYKSARPLTLRSLATHTSGLVREVPDCDECTTSQEAVVKALAGNAKAILSPQFTQVHYSNLGLALLGRAAAAAAEGAPLYENYMAKEIFEVLGMSSSGFNYTDSVRARMAHGVDSDGKPVPLPTDDFEWWAPCGTMYSTCADMAKFMIKAMTHDAPADDASGMVVDGATFAEMQLTGAFGGMSGGFGGIGSGTYELAHIGNGTDHAHWAVTKAGCLDGYRSDTFMVPDLQLGIFAVATSTCDLLSDGDAITFPVANILVPAVQAALEAAESANVSAGGWLPMSNEAFVGPWPCGFNVTYDAKTLVILNWDAVYPMRLEYAGARTSADGQLIDFRMHMVGPYIEEPACHTFTSPDENACPTSCMMRMARSDANFVTFTIPAGSHTATTLASPGLGESCTRSGVPK